MRGLNAKRIVVAGAATGIGAATAKRLAEEGARVVVGDYDLQGAQRVAHEIREGGGEAYAIDFDLNDPVSLHALIEQGVAHLGGIDGLANIAADTKAMSGPDDDVSKMNGDTWAKTLAANLTSFALLIKSSLPHLMQAGGGSIVNVTSDSTKAGEKVRPAYAASKSGINALTRHAASTWGKDGIRCNAVSPGLVLTEVALATLDDDFQSNILKALPLQRLGRPDDLAATIAFLLSDDAEWVTGQVWAVNGGGGYRD